MSEFINTLDVLGDAAFTDAILEDTLEELYDDVITSFNDGRYEYSSKLKVVDCPNLKKVAVYYFGGCSVLERVRISTTELAQGVFQNCKLLTALILLKTTSICTLINAECLSGTPIKNGTGYIYVPRALVDTYKTATNWSTFANQFRALEDYTVDGTITGELDESKI